MASFEQFLEDNRLNSPWDLYDYFFYQVKDKGYEIGVDLAFDSISVDANRKYTKNIAVTDKSLKGKVVVFVSLANKEIGKGKFANFPIIKFYSNKTNDSVYFSTYSAAWELYKANKPVNRNTKQKPATPSQPVFKPKLDDSVWKANQVKAWANEYELGVSPEIAERWKVTAIQSNAVNFTVVRYDAKPHDLSIKTANVSDSFYLKRKFSAFQCNGLTFSFKKSNSEALELAALAALAAKNAGIRRVKDAKGWCLLIPLQDAKGNIKGYQKIYDFKVNFAKANEEPELRDKDYRFYAEGKKGAFIRLGSAKKSDDYVFVVEGLATGLTVHIATGKAVFVAMDAGNLGDVLATVKALGFKRPIIAADNDMGNKGNAGVYSALKAAKTHGARIFVPEFENKKVDFNDLLSLSDLNTVKKQLVFRNNPNEIVPERNVFYGALQLLKYCAISTNKDGTLNYRILNKHAWICAATAVSNQFQMDLVEAQGLIENAVEERGTTLDIERMISDALTKAMQRTREKNTAHFEAFDTVLDATDLNNETIAEKVIANKGIWLDNRPMGTGKTELMGYVLGLASSKGLTSSYLCHRQSLVANSSERIKAVSYKVIQDKHDVMYEDAIALCINSIINPRFYEYVIHSNVIFIDEIRQTLEHVAIGSIRAEERKQVFDALIFAIKQSDIVLGSDADLNQVTVDWLKHNFPEKAFFGITCQAKKPNAVIEYGSYESVFNKAVETALSQTPTLIQCDSIKATKAVFEAVNRPHLKVLVVNSENKADKEQAAFLLNPNDEIKKYDTVIHSPVIGSGVSITCDHVQGHFCLIRGVLAENEVLQIIGRNRPSQIIHIGFNDKHVKNRVNNAKTLFDGETIARTRIIDGEAVIDPLDKLRMKITARRNDSLNDIENQALLLLRVKGYALRRFSGDESIEQLVESRQLARVVHCNSVTNADDISAMDAYKLEKAESITQGQSYQLEKHKIIHEFALPSTASISSDDVVFYDSGRIVKTIHNREIANATPEQRQAVDKKQGGFKSVSKGVHADVILSLLRDRTIDQQHAAMILSCLNHHHAELAACGLGNYSKPSKYPIRAVNEFLERFGYKLTARKISSGARKGDRVYVLGSDERIDEIVARRTLQNVFKSEAVADGA